MRFYHLTTFVAATTTTLVAADDCQEVCDQFIGNGKRSHCKADGNCDQLRIIGSSIGYGDKSGEALTCAVASEMIRPAASKDAAASALSDFGAVGIRNVGNTCYMNSAIQILGHLIPVGNFFVGLRARIASSRRRIPLTEHERNVFNGFVHIFNNMYSAEHVSDEARLESLRESLLALKPPHTVDVFERDAQADAPEALQAIVHILSAISTKYGGRSLEDVFRFTQVESITCTQCGRVSSLDDTRTILNGIFTDDMRRGGDIVRLIDAINAGFTEERVKRDICTEDQCADRGFTKDATKQTFIRGDGPEILLVGLQRKVSERGRLLRIDNFVEIPGDLVLETQITRSEATGTYKLVGIIEHGGSADGGHYTAKFRNRVIEQTRTSREELWYEANDSTVIPLAGGKPDYSNTAVLFIYEKHHV